MVDFCAGDELLLQQRPTTTKAKASASSSAAVCIGCNQEIFDPYILRVAPDLEWHANCLKRVLDEHCTAFVRGGKTFCKNDYIRLFTVRCSSCGETFKKSDFVMRARHRVYHTHCFCCSHCSRRLEPGDHFALKEEQLLCKSDFDLLENANSCHDVDAVVDIYGHSRHPGDVMPSPGLGPSMLLSPMMANLPPGSGLMPLGTVGPPPPLLSGGPQGGRSHTPPSQRGGANLNQSGASNSSCSTSSSNGPARAKGQCVGGGGGGTVLHHGKKKDKGKTTRVRTVLNEKQLHTLRSCYNSNPRPDALMKEQLVEMTGLSPRVIRVWFQNKRCKDKKRQIAMRSMAQQHEKNQTINGVRLHGIGPLTVTSPSRHEPMPLIQAMDIQQYQQNPAIWQPLQPDGPQCGAMDQPGTAPFQQLIQGFGDHGGGEFGWGSAAGGGGASQMDHMEGFSPQMAVSELSTSPNSGSE